MVQMTLFDDQLFSTFKRIDVPNTLMLTANKRLSRFIHERYRLFRHQQSDIEAIAFPSLNGLSYGGWIQQQWQRMLLIAQTDKTLLTPVQELLLWESVISDSPDSPALLNVPATARMACEAWRLVNEWHWQAPDALDSVFKQWVSRFQQVCNANQHLSIAEAPALIADAILQKSILVPDHILLYGFDEVTPAMRRVIEACEQRHCEVEALTLAVKPAAVQRYEFQDAEQELRAAAEWARATVRRDPQLRVGIVVPELASQRARVERVFNRVFEPDYIFPQQPQHAPGFNLSAGQSLVQLPVIWVCLQLLHWNRDPLDIETVSKLLLSPFWGSLSELDARALMDMQLRDLGEIQVTLQQLKVLAAQQCSGAEDGGPSLCPDMWARLTDFDRLKKSTFAVGALPSRWSALWIEQLQLLGWPGQRRLDSLEYQQVQSWQHCLDDVCALDSVLGEVSHANALQAFVRLLTESRFQPQTKTSPVQILGILEAAGLPFDVLWMMNLDDETWPQTPNPNPLLALHEQIALQLPQCSAERELAYAQRLTSRLMSCTREMVFSSARSREDKQLNCSPLVTGYCPNAEPFPVLTNADDDLDSLLFKTRDIESLKDVYGPHISQPDQIRGGSQILKSQSACPFQAFARHRLHSAQPESCESGLTAAERGNLVHAVLETLWRRLKNQAQLLALSDEQLDQLIADCVDQALQIIRGRRFVGERFLTIEGRRLSMLTRAWLELEKQRQPFAVAFNERSRTVELGGMPIHIRYDRVDQLADGSFFVLDYKTGKPEIRDWNGERPNEPQVPLYAIANQKLVSGAAFGLIADDVIAIKGIAEDAAEAPGLTEPDALKRMELPANWQDILAHWRCVLEKLAAEFLEGYAAVSPKQPPVTCRYCELQPLCRIREQLDVEASDESAT